jgi:Receptor L domain
MTVLIIKETISQLESFGSGCTIMNGTLEINIVDDVSNLTAELQTYLGDIEEIHGNLLIHRYMTHKNLKEKHVLYL